MNELIQLVDSLDPLGWKVVGLGWTGYLFVVVELEWAGSFEDSVYDYNLKARDSGKNLWVTYDLMRYLFHFDPSEGAKIFETEFFWFLG